MYKIVRFYSDDRSPRMQRTGLTLEEAKKYLNSYGTSGTIRSKGRIIKWFDGFVKI